MSLVDDLDRLLKMNFTNPWRQIQEEKRRFVADIINEEIEAIAQMIEDEESEWWKIETQPDIYGLIAKAIRARKRSV